MLCIKKGDKWTEGRTDECPRGSMPLQLLRSWGHKKNSKGPQSQVAANP